MKRSILCFVLALISMMVMTSCRKSDEYPLLTGKWVNTAETYFDNISGGHFADEGTITIEFKGHKTTLGGEWNDYWVEEESGRPILHVDVDGNYSIEFRISELTKDRLVLDNGYVDACIRLVMRRAD